MVKNHTLCGKMGIHRMGPLFRAEHRHFQATRSVLLRWIGLYGWNWPPKIWRRNIFADFPTPKRGCFR